MCIRDSKESGSFDELKEELMEVLRHSFRPEFINRIDEIIVFQALTKEQLTQITRLMLDRAARRLRAQHIEVDFSDEAVEHLAEIGFDPEFGARPLRRAPNSGSKPISARCSTASSEKSTSMCCARRRLAARSSISRVICVSCSFVSAWKTMISSI